MDRNELIQRLKAGKSLLTPQDKLRVAKAINAKRQYEVSRNPKPPKLRFKPGMMVRSKNTKQLYCIRVIFRLMDNPHEWRLYLEERNDLGKPSTATSALCEAIAGEGMNACLLHYDCVRDVHDVPGVSNLYHYGDGRVVTNKTMLNEMEVVSSGQIE